MNNIRPYSDKDHDVILDIYNQSKLDELINEKQQFELLPLNKDIKRYDDLMESNIFVYDDQSIQGYCAFCQNEIRALFVHPTFRKKGVGIKLLEFMLKKQFKNTIVLYVAKSNTLAKKLYKKYGFEVVEEFQTTYNKKSVVANKMQRKIMS